MKPCVLPLQNRQSESSMTADSMNTHLEKLSTNIHTKSLRRNKGKILKLELSWVPFLFLNLPYQRSGPAVAEHSSLFKPDSSYFLLGVKQPEMRVQYLALFSGPQQPEGGLSISAPDVLNLFWGSTYKTLYTLFLVPQTTVLVHTWYLLHPYFSFNSIRQC